MPTKMADQFGELDLFLAAAKDCGIVFLLNQSLQSISPCFGSRHTSAIFIGICWWISLAAASADPVSETNSALL